MTPTHSNEYSAAFCEAVIERLGIDTSAAALANLLDAAHAEYAAALNFDESAAKLRQRSARIAKAAEKLTKEIGDLKTLVQLCGNFEIVGKHGVETLADARNGDQVAMAKVSASIEAGCEQAAQIWSAVVPLAKIAACNSEYAGVNEFLEDVYEGGDTALKQWIWSLHSIYSTLTGKPPTLTNDPRSGTLKGPFAEFVRSVVRAKYGDAIAAASLDGHLKRIVTDARKHDRRELNG